MSDEFQFYPTPLDLAKEAWDMFQDKDIARLLEPSAGDGDLLTPCLQNYGNRFQGNKYAIPVDVLELDASKHPLLKSKGARVVGHDFMEFTGVGRYSHVIMNPPFAYGAQHLLHAWEHLYEGEIVCILNAETLRNAFSKERQHLLRIIAEHGRVKFIENAFSDAQRKTDVEIALVHLVKKASASNLVGDLFGQMREDRSKHEDDFDFGFQQQLALPKGLVEDAVLRFDVAVAAAKESAMARAKASYYSQGLGRTFAELSAKEIDATQRAKQLDNLPKQVRKMFAEDYDELKDRAWMSVLRSTEVLSKLSSKAQKRIESEFETIKGFEFTARNVYGFLQGLCESATEIQLDMVLDVFDEIVRYHEENTVFYMGWKSNGRHRTAGMRLKTTRFILPGHATESWHKSLDYDSRRLLADFDKVFAMLDGKQEKDINGLRALFEDKETFDRLRSGSREKCDYFEVRYYPGRGTIHFFPRSKELMDRLNRMVGKRRQWLPPEDNQANADFHAQYARAERFDTELREAFKNAYSGNSGASRAYGRADWALSHVVRTSQKPDAQRFDDREEDESLTCMDQALDKVMQAHGWNPSTALENESAQKPLLLAA